MRCTRKVTSMRCMRVTLKRDQTEVKGACVQAQGSLRLRSQPKPRKDGRPRGYRRKHAGDKSGRACGLRGPPDLGPGVCEANQKRLCDAKLALRSKKGLITKPWFDYIRAFSRKRLRALCALGLKDAAVIQSNFWGLTWLRHPH